MRLVTNSCTFAYNSLLVQISSDFQYLFKAENLHLDSVSVFWAKLTIDTPSPVDLSPLLNQIIRESLHCVQVMKWGLVELRNFCQATVTLACLFRVNFALRDTADGRYFM